MHNALSCNRLMAEYTHLILYRMEVFYWGRDYLGESRNWADNIKIGKGKFFLCFLTEHHAMKAHWRSVCIAPHTVLPRH
jgi:hypothetical protein